MCDGDTLLVVKDQSVVKIAKRNMQGVVPLYYEMKKAEPTKLDYDSIYAGLNKSYTSGRIGIYSNNISKVWNTKDIGEEQESVVKWLCMESNYSIKICGFMWQHMNDKTVNL